MSDIVSPHADSVETLETPGNPEFVSRRRVLKIAGTALAAQSALMSERTTAQASPSPAPLDWVDYLNFLLNIHYLQASLYSGAIRGQFLPASILGQPAGTPTQTNPSAVNLVDPVFRGFVAEMLDTEIAHINNTRAMLDKDFLGQPPAVIRTIPAPAMTLNTTATLDDGFSRVFGGMIRELYGRAFELYGVEDDCLIAISHLKDIAATAYQGVTPLVDTSEISFASILGTQASEAAILRDFIYERAQQPGSRLFEISNRLAAVRSSIDPSMPFTDQGVSPVSTFAGFASNIIPTDDRGRSKPRTPLQVLLLLVGRPVPFVDGLFFPRGVNGRINLALYGIT